MWEGGGRLLKPAEMDYASYPVYYKRVWLNLGHLKTLFSRMKITKKKKKKIIFVKKFAGYTIISSTKKFTASPFSKKNKALILSVNRCSDHT